MGKFVNPDNTAFQVALNSEIYVDKTGLIEYTNRVMDTNQALICNSRPRRFGKSITANMLVAYYSRGCDSEKMFEGTIISKNKYFREHLNKYDVIRLDIQWFLAPSKPIENIVQRIEDSVVSELKECYPTELTEQDIKKMEEEIEYRKLVVRKQALEAVKEARAHGDLSENFEYHAAKKDKNQNESRIRYLERMIKTAKIISTDSADDEVGMNNTVTVYFEEDDEEEIYRIVTTVRGNSLKNLISNESPLGKALLGHKVGDRVEVRVNEGYSYFVEIRHIENTVDDGTDKLRSF